MTYAAVFAQRVLQIRRAHASARPKDENPAWKNSHHDCGVLLDAIDMLVAEQAALASMLRQIECQAQALATRIDALVALLDARAA
ncbi:hypothetical protein [Paraburkholderia sp. BR14320]|uniref:hypothetical protein n=1 Tax=unclassified Paraburkholderia TaxID=2615204 RepID=UPI0034CD2B87